MFQCHVCGSKEARENLLTQIFLIDNKPVIVEYVPANVCVRCGEAVFDISTIEKIRCMIYGKAKPVKSVITDVFYYGIAEAAC